MISAYASKKLVISRKQSRLLLESEVTIEYSWLVDYLSRKPTPTYGDVSMLDQDKQAFVDKMLRELILTASKEWKARDRDPLTDLGPDESKWSRCNLCNRPIRYECTIVNSRNGKELIVGTKCVRDFRVDTGGRSVDEMIRQAEALRRRGEMVRRFPELSDKLGTWATELRELPIVIPNNLSERYHECIRTLRQLWNDYIDGKGSGDTFSTIRQVLASRDQIRNSVDQYVLENKDRPFVATRAVERWLEEESRIDSTVLTPLREIRKLGIVEWKTACRIAEPEFVRSIVKTLNSHLTPYGVSITHYDAESRAVALSVEPEPAIVLACGIRQLISSLGGLAFGHPLDAPPTMIALQISAVKLGTSAELALSRLRGLMRGCSLAIGHYYSDFGDVLIADIDTGQQTLIPVDRLLSGTKLAIWKVDDLTPTDLERRVRQQSPRFRSPEDMSAILAGREA